MHRARLIALAIGILVSMGTPDAQRGSSTTGTQGITAVPGIRVGHFTRTERPTGCTVILAPPNTVGAVAQVGGAPATAETDLLKPENFVNVVHAIVLSGGSTFGLDTRAGVMKYLEEQKIGFELANVFVPIVAAAALFDLPVGGRPDIRPDATCGYEAARRAAAGPIEEGSVGAGAGATVGKLGDVRRPMKGGIGTAALRVDTGLIVGAIVAVNAVGNIIDRRTGQAIAGLRGADGRTIEDPFRFTSTGGAPPGTLLNTTIGVVATNAALTKAQALKVAQMASAGYARSIVPSFTTTDGDTLFVLATGGIANAAPVDVTRIGAAAAEAVSDAIERGVRLAKGLPGYPAVSDIR